MSYGMKFNNANSKRLIGSDTSLPRFIGKYSKATLDISSLTGNYIIHTIPSPTPPLCFLSVGINSAAASINRIVDNTNGTYDVYVSISYATISAAINLSTVEVYAFAAGFTTTSPDHYGMRVWREDSTLAFDSGYKHLRMAGVMRDARSIAILCAPGTLTANFPAGSTIWNTTRNESALVESSGVYNATYDIAWLKTDPETLVQKLWANTHTYATTQGGATVATSTANSAIDSGANATSPLAAQYTTWASAGITKPAIMTTHKDAGYNWYYRYWNGLASTKFWHFWQDSYIYLNTANIQWGYTPTTQVLYSNYSVLGTQAQFDYADANAGIRIGTFGSITHSFLDPCVACGASCTISSAYNNVYYLTMPQVTWFNLWGANIEHYIIDGADYDA